MEGRGLGSRTALDGEKDVKTGEKLAASAKVQRLQKTLHAKAKETPSFRFYSLCDKVWRSDASKKGTVYFSGVRWGPGIRWGRSIF